MKWASLNPKLQLKIPGYKMKFRTETIGVNHTTQKTHSASPTKETGKDAFFSDQTRSTPFFGPSKASFFSGNGLQTKPGGDNQAESKAGLPELQMKPGDCKLPLMGSKQFAGEIKALKEKGQITSTEADKLLKDYGVSGKISRCVRAHLIHDLKTKGGTTPASKPAVQTPPPAAPARVKTPPASGKQPAATARTSVPLPLILSDADRKIQASLEQFLDRFSNIQVTVTWIENTGQNSVQKSEVISVHPPYFIALGKTVESAKDNRDAERKIKAFFKEMDKSVEKGGFGLHNALIAKASPEEIQLILQRALDQNLIKPGKGQTRPNNKDMQDWLKLHGIGVDCSGYVSQALNQIMREMIYGPLSKEQELDVADIYSGNLKGGRGKGRRFEKVETPKEIRPGDTMHVDRPDEGDKKAIDHIRIIMSVRITPEGYFEFTTAESTAGGPRSATWRYKNPDKFGDKNPLETLKSGKDWKAGKKSKETITYGRYKQLKTVLNK